MQCLYTSESIGQDCIQTVLLLVVGNGEVAQVLPAYGDDGLTVGVQLFQAVGYMYQSYHGEYHALVTHGEVVHELPGVLPPLLHASWHLGAEVVLAVLPLLPAGYVRLHAQDYAVHLSHRLVGGYRYNIYGQHHAPCKLRQGGYKVIGQESRVFPQKQHPAELVSHLKITLFKVEAVGTYELPQVFARSHGPGVVIAEILLPSRPEKIMEHSQPLVVSYGQQAGVQPGEALGQVSLHPPEIAAALLYLPLGYGHGDKSLLHQIVAFAALSQDYAVCFLPVVVHPVPGIAQQHTPLEFHRIQPVVDHGYLGGGIGGHGVYCAAVGSYYAPLGLRGGGHIVHVRELPAAAVFPAHGPNAVRVYGLYGYGLLHAPGYLQLVPLALVCRYKSLYHCSLSFPRKAS